MSHDISNSDDVIDSRDVIARIEELEGMAEVCGPCNGEGKTPDGQCGECAGEGIIRNLDESESDELDNLRALQEEAEGYAPDWQYGATLIRDSYFKDYAMDLAEDIGALPKDHTWPAYCIDWDWAARDLQMDYTSVEFDGVTYWVR